MTNAEARFNKSHIRKVYACLAVTCHLHFWQNDRDFLRATAVTRGWNGYRNKSQHRNTAPWRRKFSRRSSRDSNPRPFNHESGALTTELSPPRFIIQSLRVFIWFRFSSDFPCFSILSPAFFKCANERLLEVYGCLVSSSSSWIIVVQAILLCM